MAIYYAVGKHRDRCPTAGANKDGLGDCCSREKVGLYFLYRHEQLVWVHTATACAQRCTATACCTLYTRPGCALPGDTSAVLCVALRLQQQQSRWLARRMAVRSLSCALRLLVQSTKTLHLQLIVRCTAPHHTVCWFRQQQHLLPTSTEAHPRMFCIANKHGLEGLKAKGGTGKVYRLDSSSTIFFCVHVVYLQQSLIYGANFLDHGTTTTGTHYMRTTCRYPFRRRRPSLRCYNIIN